MKKSFEELTKPQNLSRIKIDSRLIPAFCSVMKKMQSFFNANYFESIKDYQKFFEDYLLDKDFTIIINDKPISNNTACIYSKEDNSIIISAYLYENYEKKVSRDDLEHALFNAFIHFITMHDLNVENSSEEVYKSGFICEGLIETMTMQNYTNIGLFSPQVRMLEFANILSDNTNDYRELLSGRIDTKNYGSGWANFYLSASLYHDEYKEYNEDIYNAMLNSNYKKAQRYLIESFYAPSKMNSIDDYFEMITKLEKRVVRDESFIENFIAKCEIGLINNIVGNDKKLHDIFTRLFDEYHETEKKIKRYGSTPVYEVDFGGYHLVVDPDGIDHETIYPRPGNSLEKSIDGRIVTYKVNDKVLNINLEEVPYINYEHKKEFMLDKLRTNLRVQNRSDIKAVKEVASSDKELIKLERFTLPNIGFENKASKDVYIAYYNTGIEVLTDYPSIKQIDGVNIDRYIGMTTVANASLVARESIVTNTSGILYSTASKDYVNNKVITTVENLLKQSLKPGEYDLIYETYKNSENYCKNESVDQERLDALFWYATDRFYSLSEEKRRKLIDSVIDGCDKFIVTTINGVISVAKMVSDTQCYIAKKETLVDSRMPSLYNTYYDTIRTKKENESIEILTEANGNLLRPESSSDIEETSGAEIIDIIEETIRIDSEEIRKRLA